MSSGGQALLGAIEAGGTKFVLAVGTSPTDIVARHVIPTQSPGETLPEAARWLAAQGPIAALGLASFGPLDLDRASPTWGHITNTPKPGWRDCDIAGHFADALGCPVGFDTDVNAAALAEYRFGAGQRATSLAYVTVGTGIGGGLVIHGQPVHGAGHPEMGHILPRRPAQDRDFAGICPHHGDCLEGLASGPAIAARWGKSLSELPPGHEAHGIVADYLAQLCHALFATVSAEVIVLGGGVMQTPGLLASVRQRALALDANYLPGRSRCRIEAPGLGTESGIAGAIALASG